VDFTKVGVIMVNCFRRSPKPRGDPLFTSITGSGTLVLTSTSCQTRRRGLNQAGADLQAGGSYSSARAGSAIVQKPLSDSRTTGIVTIKIFASKAIDQLRA